MSLLYYGTVLKGDGLIGFFSYTWFLVSAIRVFLCFFLMSAKMQKALPMIMRKMRNLPDMGSIF
jgi:hypothetical protein